MRNFDAADYDELFRTEDVDWHPLEGFFCDTKAPELQAFGFGGHWDRAKGGSIRMYFNSDTKRLLMIDEELECYVLTKSNRPKRVSRVAALRHVYEPLKTMDPWIVEFIPRPEIYDCGYDATARTRRPHLSVVR
jgi:hypothetical protein